MTGASGSDLPRRRSNLTGRAAALAIVVCMLAISLAYPLREYLAQRAEIAHYRAQVAQQQDRVAALERARDRWRDPQFVEAQARERLQYVMPGETAYVVLGPGERPSTDGMVKALPAEQVREPWFADLWHSIEVAGRRDRS